MKFYAVMKRLDGGSETAEVVMQDQKVDITTTIVYGGGGSEPADL